MEYDEGRNPVSLINEFCQSRKTEPIFKVVHDEGEPHAKKFTVSCTVHDFVTTGQGRSVKQGRTNCAASMIEKLREEGLMNAEFLEGKGKKSFSSLKGSLLKTKIEDNPIGCLQEYCMSAKIPLPEYTDTITEQGFKTLCKVNDITCEGCGRQKKLSKAEAAKNMCEILFEKQLNDEVNVSKAEAAKKMCESLFEKQLNDENEIQVEGVDKKAEEAIEPNDEASKNGPSEEFNNNSGQIVSEVDN